MDILRSQPFKVTLVHDGVDTDGYKLYVNGVLHASQVGKDFDFLTGLPKGTYTLGATAFNADGETDPFNHTLVILPKKPQAVTGVTVVVI